MSHSADSVELIASYLEALGLASGERARRRAHRIVTDCRARTAEQGEIGAAELFRLAREQVLLADSLAEPPLPPEVPTKMPPQSFGYSGLRGGIDLAPRWRWKRTGGAAEAGG